MRGSVFLGLQWGGTSWWQEHVVEEEAFGGQVAESEERTGHQVLSSKHTPSDLLSPTRPHLLTFPELYRVVLPTGDRSIQHISLWGILHIKIITNT
jgi:hypothetical protein